MELEAVQLPEDKINLFGDENEGGGGDSSGGGDDSGSLFGGGDSGDSGDSGGDDSGGGGDLSDLFSGEIKKGNLMSEEELSQYDELLGEDDSEKDDKDENPIKASNKTRGKRKKSMSGNTPIYGVNAKDINKLGELPKVISTKDLSSKNIFDSIMPQSPIVDNFIDRQISRRDSIDLNNLSNKLNLNTNKLLKESNDKEIDIFIDDDILNNEED